MAVGRDVVHAVVAGGHPDTLVAVHENISHGVAGNVVFIILSVTIVSEQAVVGGVDHIHAGSVYAYEQAVAAIALHRIHRKRGHIEGEPAYGSFGVENEHAVRE